MEQSKEAALKIHQLAIPLSICRPGGLSPPFSSQHLNVQTPRSLHALKAGSRWRHNIHHRISCFLGFKCSPWPWEWGRVPPASKETWGQATALQSQRPADKQLGLSTMRKTRLKMSPLRDLALMGRGILMTSMCFLKEIYHRRCICTSTGAKVIPGLEELCHHCRWLIRFLMWE